MYTCEELECIFDEVVPEIDFMLRDEFLEMMSKLLPKEISFKEVKNILLQSKSKYYWCEGILNGKLQSIANNNYHYKKVLSKFIDEEMTEDEQLFVLDCIQIKLKEKYN